MWAPRSSYRGQSRGRRRWCWTWRWSRSTMSSTSEAAPSSVWQYLYQSIRFEGPKWTSLPQKKVKHEAAVFTCSWCNSLLVVPPPLIMSPSVETQQDSAENSWREDFPVLESPPLFNRHWAFTTTILTFNTQTHAHTDMQGYLWCTISEDDLTTATSRRIGVYTHELVHLSVNLHPFT